jgi:hypothetical protein
MDPITVMAGIFAEAPYWRSVPVGMRTRRRSGVSAVVAPTRTRQTGLPPPPPKAAGLLYGIDLGGFIDGIVPHQFNSAAQECHGFGDHGTAAVFEEMVRDEEKHVEWFEAQLDALLGVSLLSCGGRSAPCEACRTQVIRPMRRHVRIRPC